MVNNNKEKTLKEMKEELEALSKAIQQKEQEELAKKMAEEKERKAEFARQKEARKKDIDKKTKELSELIKKFIEDYGYYSNANANTTDDTRTLLSYWIHKFWI